MADKYIKTSLKKCAVCGNSNLLLVLELPKLPLIGIYVRKGNNAVYPKIDNALMFCRKCSHAQLRNVVDPAYLYGDTYSHRTSLSIIARGGNDFILDFIKGIGQDRIFDHIVEIGCNDLYLLKKISKLGKKLTGIDPLLKQHEKESAISLVPKFIEEVDIDQDLGNPADLIIASHIFEHLENPRDVLQKMAKISSDNAIFVLAVPSFESLVYSARFDKVFHQHLHCFSLLSLVALIRNSGFYYLKHAYDSNCWGGAIVLAFTKKNNRVKLGAAPFVCNRSKILKQLKVFRKSIDSIRSMISSFTGVPMVGYGASQILPIMAYHLHTDMSFLEFILDDDVRKDGLSYPGLKVSIKCAQRVDLTDKVVFITVLDSIRLIINKLSKMNPRSIIVPAQIS